MKKKNNSYIGISFIVLLFGIWVVPKIVDYLSKSDFVTIGKVPQFSFIDQNGKTITNKTYYNKVYVIEFFFTTCPTICPKTIVNMKKLQDEFLGNPNFGIASITVDPKTDTPAILRKYAKDNAITLKNWHLLTGTKKSIETFSNKGLKLYASEDSNAPGGFEHSGYFVLVDKQGNIRSRYDDLGNAIVYYDGIESQATKILQEDIAKLLKE